MRHVGATGSLRMVSMRGLPVVQTTGSPTSVRRVRKAKRAHHSRAERFRDIFHVGDPISPPAAPGRRRCHTHFPRPDALVVRALRSAHPTRLHLK
jgi:hypothetical protein